MDAIDAALAVCAKCRLILLETISRHLKEVYKTREHLLYQVNNVNDKDLYITQPLLNDMTDVYYVYVKTAVAQMNDNKVNNCFDIPSQVDLPTGHRTVLDVYDLFSDKLLLLEGEIYHVAEHNTCYSTTRGGAALKKKTHTAKWVKTGRKVPVKGGRGLQRTVYRNATTGELRVRKMVARNDGIKRVSYVKF